MSTKQKNTTFNHDFDYLQWIVEARRLTANVSLDEDEDYRRSYELISANLGLLAPNVPTETHEDFSRLVKYYQMWAARDQREFSLITTTKIKDKHKSLSLAKKGQGVLFCTFHTGSYRLLNHLLSVKNIPFSLITDNNFVTTQGDEVKQTFLDLKEWYPRKIKMEALEVLDAEEPKVALQTIRRLRQGHSMVVYLDGNTGVGGYYADPAKRVKVDFFGQDLFARKGIGFMAHVAGVPIVPVLSIRTDWLEREIHFLDPILPEADEHRDAFSDRATQTLFTILEQYVRDWPEQWEGWFYIHKFLDINKLQNNTEDQEADAEILTGSCFQLNQERYSPVTFFGQKVLMDKQTYTVYPLSRELELVLDYFKQPHEIEEIVLENVRITEAALKELAESGILMPESQSNM